MPSPLACATPTDGVSRGWAPGWARGGSWPPRGLRARGSSWPARGTTARATLRSLGPAAPLPARHARSPTPPQALGQRAPAAPAPAEEPARYPGVTLAIEGNIGSGKSTLLEILEMVPVRNDECGDGVPPLPTFRLVHEPVDEWVSVPLRGEATPGNLLHLFYSDPSRYGYLFQHYVLFTRMRRERATRSAGESTGAGSGEGRGEGEGAGGRGGSNGRLAPAPPPSSLPTRVLERTVFSDRAVFVEAAVEGGAMLPLEEAVYDAWFDAQVGRDPGLAPDGFVYLRVPPEVCMTRLARRSRSEEAGIPLEYLARLHQAHERWFLGGVGLSNAGMPREGRKGALAGAGRRAEVAPALAPALAPAGADAAPGSASASAAALAPTGAPDAPSERAPATPDSPPCHIPHRVGLLDASRLPSSWPATLGHHLDGIPVLVLDYSGEEVLREGPARSELLRKISAFAAALDPSAQP